MTVSMADPDVGEREAEAVREVIHDGQLADGEEVRRFEAEFAAHCGARHGVATANGTAALTTALRALGVGDGDRVVTSPFTFVATANAVRLCGARPVFADVDPETYALDPDAVETVAAETDDVAAILAVHLYGLPAEVDALRAVADRHDCALVEDAAQAHGATYRGDPVGSLGDAATFSFYPTKNMTTGEGGMVTTDRADVAERARRFVDHGRADRHQHVAVGHNLRLTSMAAAIGRVQLQKLADYVAARRTTAAAYTDALSGHPTVVPPFEPDHVRHAYHQYTVRADDREALAAHLEDAGVETAVYYPRPVHRQPAYADYEPDAPAAEAAADEVLSLPVHPRLSDDAVSTVVETLRSYAPESHAR